MLSHPINQLLCKLNGRASASIATLMLALCAPAMLLSTASGAETSTIEYREATRAFSGAVEQRLGSTDKEATRQISMLVDLEKLRDFGIV